MLQMNDFHDFFFGNLEIQESGSRLSLSRQFFLIKKHKRKFEQTAAGADTLRD